MTHRLKIALAYAKQRTSSTHPVVRQIIGLFQHLTIAVPQPVVGDGDSLVRDRFLVVVVGLVGRSYVLFDVVIVIGVVLVVFVVHVVRRRREHTGRGRPGRRAAAGDRRDERDRRPVGRQAHPLVEEPVQSGVPSAVVVVHAVGQRLRADQ